MLKTALFDCAINEKCCSVHGGRSICPLFSSPPWGIWQLKSPHPGEFAIQGKKKLELTDALQRKPCFFSTCRPGISAVIHDQRMQNS